MHRLFKAGCILLVLTGLAHLLGHYSMVTATGEQPGASWPETKGRSR